MQTVTRTKTCPKQAVACSHRRERSERWQVVGVGPQDQLRNADRDRAFCKQAVACNHRRERSERWQRRGGGAPPALINADTDTDTDENVPQAGCGL